MMNPPPSPPSSPPAPFSSELKVDQFILEYLRKRKNEVMKKLKTSTITDKDLLGLQPHPSDYHLVYFAVEVYKNENDFIIPNGWELLIPVANTKFGNGYVGAAFFNPVQQQIIIAHRGTNGITDYNSWWNNLKGVVKCSSSPQIRSALTFADFIRDVIVELRSEKKWRYQLSFTGHSLGGFLAQITTFGVKYLQRCDDDVFRKSTDAGVHGHCVTFDNPGCAEMLDRITDHCDLRYLKTISPNTLDVTAYLSAPNKVNMCNRHVGVVLRLKLSFEEIDIWSVHFINYLVTTHDKDTIKSAFHPDGVKITVEVDQILDWPVTYGFSKEESKFFECSGKENNFYPDLNETVVPIGKGRFNEIRYYSRKHSVNSCNVSLFSEDELFLLKHWLKIVQSPFTINETFSPLNRPFKDFFSQFNQIGDDLKFDEEVSMRKTIKWCKQIVRWYPKEIKTFLSSFQSKLYDAIMKVAFDSYNESFNDCNVDFNDSIELQNFLEAKENVLTIKPSANNYKIEMLRLFNIFKQIRSKQNVIIDKYTGNDNFLFVNQPYLLSLFKYTEIDLFINSQLKLLIVDLLNETVNDDVSNLITGFAKGVRKVVIVSGSNIDLSPTSSREIASPEFKFTDLTVASQEWALHKKIIKFRNETYSLASLFNAANDSWTENSPIVNDYQFLDLLLNGRRYIELKNDSLNLSKLENFYIQAGNDQSYSRDDFVNLIENPECDLNESKILITHVCDRLNLQIPCDQLQTADLNEASQYFKKRCNEESPKKFYWFHYDQKVSLKKIYNPRLYIPRSFNEMVLDETKITNSINEQLLRQKNEGTNNVTVELMKTGNQSLTCNFRVNRKSDDKVVYVWDGKDNNNKISDIRDFLTISRDGSLAEQELRDRRVMLITGDPGIGKSTTVTNLISKIKPSWVFKLTYNDCVTIVIRLNGKFEIDRIAEQLLKFKTNDEFDFLKYHLAGKTKIKVVFLFDEIFDSSYEQKHERPIIEFLQYLRDKTKSFIVVTSRETKREMIENALKTFSIQFEQLNREDVEGYLTNYWSNLFHLDLKLKPLTLDGLNDYIKRLLDKATEIFDPNILNFAGIPLQMKLLAEVAAPDCASLSKSSPDGIPLKLPDNITGIYETFVEKKLAIVCNKESLREWSSFKKVYLKSIDKQLRAFSASKYGFDDDNFEELDTLQVLQETGLIQGSEFIHQTIQEFYFARQIFAWLKKRKGRHGDKRPELVEFLLKKIFVSYWEFSIVRMFLDTYVSQITPEDAPFYSRKIVEELMNESSSRSDMDNLISSKRLFCSLILMHCQGIVIFLLESFKKYHETEAAYLLPLLNNPYVYDERNVLFVACGCNQTRVIDYFVQFLKTQSKETLNRIIMASFYQLPEQRFLDALENFIARTRIPAASARNVKKIADLVKEEIGLRRAFIAAIENGFVGIVRHCLTKVSDTLKPNLLSAHSFSHGRGNNALHLAITQNHQDIVRLLIEHESEVNQVNSNKMTPIHLACETGNLEILRLLIEHGGDYKKGDNRGVTPFHKAAQKGHADVVEYFLKELKYKKVNKITLDGDTALSLATRNRQERVVDILFKYNDFFFMS